MEYFSEKSSTVFVYLISLLHLRQFEVRCCLGKTNNNTHKHTHNTAMFPATSTSMQITSCKIYLRFLVFGT